MTEQELLAEISRLGRVITYERRLKEEWRENYQTLLSDYYDLEEDYENALDNQCHCW